MFKRQDSSKLQAQLAALKGGNGFSKEDPKEWKIKTDAAGNGEALIRFLPSKTEDGLPIVKLVNHSFKVNGKWYWENCSSTHGDFDSCPVCKYINEKDLYNTDKTEWQLIKRKASYYANILVLKDPQAPENEGKVFKFRFGQKIYDKIVAMVNVNTDMGEVPVDVTCVFSGANFLLKAKKVDKHQNYDDSRFMQQSQLPKIEDEAYQKYLMENMVDLGEIVAPSQFKPFDELETKFKKTMGVSMVAGAAASSAAAAINSQLDDFDAQMNAFDAGTTSAITASSSSADDLMASLDLGGGTSSASDLDDLDSLLNL
ncbi:single-strand DNA binding protein [Escherichia phage vB_EcoM_011D4]|uniref:Single-stranded DNA-binding protein n=1 Tax=Escherichia phage vB_EcoM_011D4 TaxID=2735300 RepID=A0A7D7IV73_9CAUD|nr:single-strand DNA binding protein [Escherichia phage vB_EcoM_011D4]